MPGSPKVCIACQQDCSARPRTKDLQGRYTCQACADKLARAKASPRPAAATAPAPAPAPANPSHQQQPEPEPELSIDLLQDEAKAQTALATDKVIDLAPPPPSPSNRPGKLPAFPGMNRAAQPAKCSKCGYNMQGLESSKCPECGTINAPKDYRAILQEQSKDLARKTWLTPILVTLGCLLASSVCWGISPAGLPGVLVMLVSWGIMVPVGLLAFWLCTLIFLEFDAPWGVTILRLAQIFAIMTLPGALLATLGYYTVATRGLVGLALMVILCITILEVEMTDAIWLSIVINILQAVIIMVMVQAFASM